MKEQVYNQQKPKVSQILLLGFGWVFLMVIFVAVFPKLKTNSLVDTTNSVTYTYKIWVELNALGKTLVDAETGQGGFIFTGKVFF